jgi:hypothetical protein
MAKRPSSRTDTQTDDTASIAPGAPKARRARVRSAVSTSMQEAAAEAADMGNAPEQTEATPTEDDIRTRAYHRFLERGGGHGQHFDDWIEAERELKNRK